MQPRSFHICTLLLCAFPWLVLAGCATTPHRETPQQPLSVLDAILADLAENDAAIQNFRASGKFVLKTPELDEVYLLRQSSMRFRRPADIRVVGRKYSKAVLELTCVGEKFLLTLPTEKLFYASGGGNNFASVSHAVTPGEIARELFLPEEWGTLGEGEARLVSEGDEAVFEIYPSRRASTPRRRVTVTGTPWRVVHSELLDEHGESLAVTELSDYGTRDGVLFPQQVSSRFPAENAFMQFHVSSYDINTDLNASDFDLQEHWAEVLRKKYDEIERTPR